MKALGTRRSKAKADRTRTRLMAELPGIAKSSWFSEEPKNNKIYYYENILRKFVFLQQKTPRSTSPEPSLAQQCSCSSLPPSKQIILRIIVRNHQASILKCKPSYLLIFVSQSLTDFQWALIFLHLTSLKKNKKAVLIWLKFQDRLPVLQ